MFFKTENLKEDKKLFNKALKQLVGEAEKIREVNFGKKIQLRMAYNYLPNQKCSADCKFCAWSCKARTEFAKNKGLVISEKVGINIGSCLKTAEIAERLGACMELVSNTEYLNYKITGKLCELKDRINVPVGIQPGIVQDHKVLSKLRDIGFSWYSNDLETARSYFPYVCTTHTIGEKVRSLLAARKAGFEIWSGFCMGMGEKYGQRLEAIELLKKIDVEGVILNFFYNIPGIVFYNKFPVLSPEEILKTIAVIRIILPEKPIIIGGGRKLLQDQRHRIYEAGATGIYLGTFLNHPRPSVKDDLDIIRRLNLQIVQERKKDGEH